MGKFRKLYEKHLWLKIVTVIIIVLLSVAIMLPLVKIAELFGINIRENAGLNSKVEFGNVFFFFLFGVCSISIIWLAQKYIHKKPLSELGLQRKIWLPSLIGFIIGVTLAATRYFILIVNAENVNYTSVIPEDVSLITYIGYYLYFFFGFIFWNSFIEELGMRAYPIQKLKKHMNPHIVFTIMGLIFTVFHFFLHDFSIGYFISLFMTSYIFSLLYYYSGSIWLVVGIHSGTNWVGFSFFGTNWELGTLCNIAISDVANWIVEYVNVFIYITFLLLVLFLKKKGFFRKHFPKTNEIPNTLK
ncbi:CPBP family intramembrane glutamic endopeptidase [Winogradskyella psychrotolerans]|uniref:CPBP family intramembrane glutamic endopeptidase n=1 Tax=Winogradskyella psychrotolerans TaxID=1344585 RepID=UPI001C07562D|nr:CPBP family intramembrane glutamic endopeptidase [Winogradskyella psychrotolerans]MBU2928762.1 CPBP family intramembrane metalloprotease [Winogradskyella psychrotolerans]